MAAVSDIFGGAASGAGIGAAGGPIGAAIGAGVGAIAGIGKWLFGKSEARRAKKQYEDLQKQAEERQSKAIATGEERAGKLYGDYAIDSTKLKGEYEQAMKRSLQQAAGGMTASLSSLRGGINPALGAHLLTGRAAEMGAQAAGESALQQEQITMQTDLYNKQLMQDLRNQEINRAMGLADTQMNYAEKSLNQQQQMRQAGINDLFNMAGQGAALGMRFSGIGAPKNPYSADMPSQATNQRGLGIDYGNYNPNPFSNPYAQLGT